MRSLCATAALCSIALTSCAPDEGGGVTRRLIEPTKELVPLVNGARENLVAAMMQVATNLAGGDMASVVEQMPFYVFSNADEMRRATEQAAAAALPEGASGLATSLEPLEPKEICNANGYHVSVVPYRGTMGGRRVVSCQIGVSRDGGRSWQLLSGSKNAVAGLERFAPGILRAIRGDIVPMRLID